MDADLKPIYDRVMQANRPEDAFVELTIVLPPRLLAEHLAPEMEEMRSVLDEHIYSSLDDKDSARVARARLDAFHEEAMQKAAKGLYSIDDYTMLLQPSGSRTIRVDGVTYAVGEKFHIGEHSSLYKGRMSIDQGSGGVVIRVANEPSDNPYLFNEIRILDLLHRSDVGYWKNIPFMLGRFIAGERVGIVSRYFEGLTLTAIRANQLHVHGLDQRHVVWVLDRLLGLLGYAHSLGIIHGRIEPERIRVRPSNHNALLTGWGQAVYKPHTTGERVVPASGVFEAPEIRDGGEVGPWTDLYCLGKTMIWLIGGNPETNEMPGTVEPKIRQFLLNMVRKNPKARPHDAWQLYEAQNRLKDSLWERRFIHLNLA
jgi:hypothetical protein